jgi:hypothetical protein
MRVQIITVLFCSGMFSLAQNVPVHGQAGSVGGTVGKTDKSLSGGRGDQAPVRSTAPAKPAVNSCQRMVGTWDWFVGGATVFASNGTGHNSLGLTFTWTCSNGTYVVSWSHGFVDRLRVSADGNSVDGSNQIGTHITGTRK